MESRETVSVRLLFTVLSVHAVPLELLACVILTRHHSPLTQSIGKDPIARSSIAGLLHREQMIDERTLAAVNSTRRVEVLLTAVKEAVFVNYQNLEKFAAILHKFTATVSVGDAIMKECSKSVIATISIINCFCCRERVH